jgi:hypothetical protein
MDMAGDAAGTATGAADTVMDAAVMQVAAATQAVVDTPAEYAVELQPAGVAHQ